MSLVHAKNTRPELVVRQLCTRLGLRYRLHRKDLPGTPDLVFVAQQTAIFVNGCFWHRHRGCRLASMPKSRTAFWKEKFAKNTARDRAAQCALRRLGWKVANVWECQTRREKIGSPPCPFTAASNLIQLRLRLRVLRNSIAASR